MPSLSQIKYDTIEKYVTTGLGRSVLASSFNQPLRTQRDYKLCSRKAFEVEELPNGAMPYYDQDPELTAYMIGEEGDNVVTQVKSKRILVPLYELATNPKLSISEITARRFNMIERVLAKGAAKLNEQEDARTFGLFKVACDQADHPYGDIVSPGGMTAAALSDAFANIESYDLRVANIFCNAKDFADIRKWDRDTLDPVSQAELLKTGIRGQLWDANIVVTKMVPAGTVYLTAEPEFFGRIPIRYDLTVLNADKPEERAMGWSMFLNLGTGLYNPYGIQRLTIIR